MFRRDANPGTGARVCSCHFPDGYKDNYPELYVHNVKKVFGKHYLSPEQRTRRTLFGNIENMPNVVTPIIAGSSTADDPMCLPGPSSVPTSAEIESRNVVQSCSNPSVLEAENFLLKLQLERKDNIIKSLKLHFTYAHICEKDNLVLEYIGLPTRKIFEDLFFLVGDIKVRYYLKWQVQKLDRKDQILMTLMKLRQNYSHTDLAFRFNVSEGTVTNIVVTFINLLHEVLFKKLMRSIPTRYKNKFCLPNCASTFTNCRIILDCTEIFAAVPRQSMKNQRLTYSSYKHRNTLKGLVGVAPNGVITYASDLYPGSTSDKSIVASCRILQQMEAGDLILADKGFLIRDLLPAGVTLNVPPFLSTPQFTPEQIRRTECIARTRIHVERAIKRMKSFKILSFVPLPLFSYSSIIFKTIAALTNLQVPLNREVSQFYIDASVTNENVDE